MRQCECGPLCESEVDKRGRCRICRLPVVGRPVPDNAWWIFIRLVDQNYASMFNEALIGMVELRAD